MEPNELADLLAPYWSERRTQDALGLTADELTLQRTAGQILGLPSTEGDLHYPVVQFETKAGRARVKPALLEFFSVLRHRDPWTVGILLRTPAEFELDNLTPLEWVDRDRDPGQLVHYARIVNAQFETR